MEYCSVKYLRLEFQVSKGGGGTRLVWRIFTRDGLNFRWPCYNLVSHYLVQSICISFSRARTYLQKVSFEGAEVWAHLEKNLGKESATKKNLTTHHTLYPLALRTLFNRNRRRGATRRNFHTSKARICGEEKKFGRIRALPCRMECAHSLRIGLLIHERNLSVSAPRYFELMNRNSLPPHLP